MSDQTIVDPDSKKATTVLGDLNLWAEPSDLDQAGWGATFAGPPSSVAVIEAGGTALSKWWSVTLGASGAVIWGGIRVFWNDNVPIHREMVWGAAIISATLCIAIAIIVSTDVRARASAQVAIVNARAAVADTVISERPAEQPSGGGAGPMVVPLPPGVLLRNVDMEGTDESGWVGLAVTVDEDASKVRYLVTKGDRVRWEPASQIRIQF